MLLQSFARLKILRRVGTSGKLLRKTMASEAQGDATQNADNEFCFSSNLGLEEIRRIQSKFSKDRNWDQFHTPRNVLLAMVAEVGEVAECFQWKGEVKEGLPDWTPEERTHLGEELSDVLVYLVRLADRCEIDLPSAVLRKIEKNAEKYPASRAYGKSEKYTAYENSTQSRSRE